jgi:hypothetical protein
MSKITGRTIFFFLLSQTFEKTLKALAYFRTQADAERSPSPLLKSPVIAQGLGLNQLPERIAGLRHFQIVFELVDKL